MGARKQRKAGATRREVLRTTALGLAGLSLVGPAKPAGAAPAVLKGKQDIVMGVGTDVVMMDSRMPSGGPRFAQVFHVVEPPMWPDEDGKPVGILLSAWEPVADPAGWRLRVRPGLKYTNGEAVNAWAIKYALESTLDEANKSWVDPQLRTRLNLVTGIRVENDLTVLVLTKGFYRTLPYHMNFINIPPPKYGAEKGKEFGVRPIGTGHYKFVEYRSASHLRLEADPAYHGHWDGPARNSSVTFRYMAENATRVAALEAGEVHLIDNLPPDAIGRIKTHPNLDVMSTSTVRINGMNFHCGRPPFDNRKARLAVMHAIDRDTIIKKIMGSTTRIATAPFPPGTLGTVGETFQAYEFDPRKARQYFAEAGLTNGTKIKVGGSIGRYINDKQIVAAVAGMIADVGFDPQIEQTEWTTYWPKAANGYYDLFYVTWLVAGYDPTDSQHVYMSSSGDKGGVTHFVAHNKRVVDLYGRLNAATSRQEAERYAKEFCHLLWDNLPIAYMFYEPNIAGLSKKLRGWKPRRDAYNFLWGAHLE